MELPNPADTSVGLGLRDRPTSTIRRHSPAPLVSLEYLQSQRRGSLTDPSLHAGPPLFSNNSPFRTGPKRSNSKPGSPPPSLPPLSTQPISPFVFGNASLQLPPPSSFSSRSHLKDKMEDRENYYERERSHQRNGRTASNSGDEMELDSDYRPGTATRDDPRLPSNFDYNMRRHSVPDGTHARIGLGFPRGPPSTSLLRAKRKMSNERLLPAVGEEVDPRLGGPTSATRPGFESDEPAPKRRNSAFDTSRMAQMSLNDRRDSVDSRASTGTPVSTWWPNDRRDSASSMFSGTSLGSSAGVNSPGLTGEQHCRQPSSMSAFAWPAKSSGGPNDASAPQGMHPPVDSKFNRHYDAPIPPHQLPPLTAMPADRRMSAPDAMFAGNRADRALRSRSRPPATTNGNSAKTAPTSPELSPDGRAEESPASNGSASQQHLMPPKGDLMSNTPYSRSPELRVSHKLAERKRRKEMRDLFDELRDQLPADRGMKASKWEILSKAIDYIQTMKQSHNEMSREVELLRHEVESTRHGLPYGHPVAPHTVMYPPAATIPSRLIA